MKPSPGFVTDSRCLYDAFPLTMVESHVTPRGAASHNRTQRATSPEVTILQARYDFYERGRAMLAEQKKGWSIGAVKAKLLHKWYGFGMRVNQANMSQPSRKAAREEKHRKRRAHREEYGGAHLRCW